LTDAANAAAAWGWDRPRRRPPVAFVVVVVVVVVLVQIDFWYRLPPLPVLSFMSVAPPALPPPPPLSPRTRAVSNRRQRLPMLLARQMQRSST
jgi:hypothetical protein